MIISEENFPCTICGRLITFDELALIREIISGSIGATRQEISRRVCRVLSWFKPDGSLKDMSCRVMLLRLYRAGLIELPPPRSQNNNVRKKIRRTPLGEPQNMIVEALSAVMPVELHRIASRDESYLWNELIDRYHYLGYAPLPGAQIRYLIHSSVGCLGALGFSAAAWKIRPRDQFIGWSDRQREKNLHLIVNNSRFLILPWVKIKNLASKVLSLAIHSLISDWQHIYNYRPVLLETFVEKERFAGISYKAANWIYVGSTQGRGKLDVFAEYKLPIKQIYLYPLVKGFRSVLQSI